MKYYFLTLLVAMFFITNVNNLTVFATSDEDFVDGSESISCETITTFKQLVECGVKEVGNPLVKLIIAASVLVFLYGVFNYVREAENETKRKEASQMILFSIIAIFVMISVWGLVNILVGTFTFTNTIPTVKFPAS